MQAYKTWKLTNIFIQSIARTQAYNCSPYALTSFVQKTVHLYIARSSFTIFSSDWRSLYKTWPICRLQSLEIQFSVRTDGLHTNDFPSVHCKAFRYNFSYALTACVQTISHLYIQGLHTQCSVQVDCHRTENVQPVDCKVFTHNVPCVWIEVSVKN